MDAVAYQLAMRVEEIGEDWIGPALLEWPGVVPGRYLPRASMFLNRSRCPFIRPATKVPNQAAVSQRTGLTSDVFPLFRDMI